MLFHFSFILFHFLLHGHFDPRHPTSSCLSFYPSADRIFFLFSLSLSLELHKYLQRGQHGWLLAGHHDDPVHNRGLVLPLDDAQLLRHLSVHPQLWVFTSRFINRGLQQWTSIKLHWACERACGRAGFECVSMKFCVLIWLVALGIVQEIACKLLLRKFTFN